VIREILNLKALGVEFVTEEFQRLVTDGLPAYHENQKRLSQKIAKHFVKFEPNGTINVLSPHGHSVFTSFDLLPTRIQEVVGMLKLVSNQNVPGEPEHRSIPGLGVQVSENAFWVLEEVDTANKAV
jgi:Fe-S oxidoreductase